MTIGASGLVPERERPSYDEPVFEKGAWAMGGGQDGFDEGVEPSGWSLVYAPDTALQPATCRSCRNVFAADADVCPWCGHTVSPTVDHASVRHLFPASVLPAAAAPAPATAATNPAAPPPDADEAEPAERAADASLPLDRLPSGRPTQARRWAGLLVAAGVILAIATGVAVRSRGSDGTTAAIVPESATTRAVATATTRATTSAPASTTPVTSAPATTPPPTTVAATTLPTATTSPATTAPATTLPATTIPATTAPATTVPVPTTSAAGPTLSESEQRAVTVTRDLSNAIVAHDWNRVRSLAPRNTATDQTYETFWGAIESAAVVPARVAARTDGSYDVFVGVLNVSTTPTGRTSALICGRYTVDVGAGVVTDVVTRELRSAAGALGEAAVAAELRASCQ